MYSSCSYVQGASQVFETVPGSDILSYNSIILGLLEHGYLNEALEVLNKMVDKPVVRDNITYVTLINLCKHLKDLKLQVANHNQIFRTGLKLDIFIGRAIIDMYGKCGKIFSVQEMFLMGYATTMWSHGQLLSWRCIKCVYKEKPDYCWECPDQHACISRVGDVEFGHQVLLDMSYRDIITWKSMICGYSHYGLGRQVFQNMLLAEEAPSYVTFVGVLSACVDKGFYYLNQMMKGIGITPRVEH
ncbi:PREDICTED: pentatricopeptide repeat-containing protein At5g39680-like [Nelumbo nucifera]|uniref:Pentatricopeptide repeat-containing protein At5g39680-like n=1 Tax=Nelumbo nucifera TaxID=4432 RepID=A0A1U8ACE9_NELNU|nr:PREDICTED: pentatricopeptide repeat-containing protein At5g39680-like [Nelumbo nucifera]